MVSKDTRIIRLATIFLPLAASTPRTIMSSKFQPEPPQQTSSQRRRYPIMYNLLWRIREEWKLLGFFEINQGHEFYPLTCMLKQGLRASIQNAIDHPEPVDIQNESKFTTVHKEIHKGFEMRTYAGPIFAWFRQFLGMADLDYQKSLSCENSYLQFISNSKSNADFFLTNDKRFFLKTQRKKEIRFLLTNLQKYLGHMERYPHSILVRFLGIHSIILPGGKKKYFIIMQSIFYPHERIVERYDIKGCEVDRWTDPAPEGSGVIIIFKDLNFENNTIHLEQQRNWLIQQVTLDTHFLAELEVIDYSFLIGLQPLHQDERLYNKALADIITRTTKSLSDHRPFSDPSPHPSMGSGLLSMESVAHVSSQVNHALSSSEYLFAPESRATMHEVLEHYLRKKPSTELDLEASTHSETFLRDVVAPYLFHVHSFDEAHGHLSPGPPLGQVRSQNLLLPSLADSNMFLAQNRRLLPNCRNPMHIIDGPEYRYFVGFIDFLQAYSWRKKLENVWKRVRYRSRTFSTVQPACYARRLCKWVEDHSK